MKLVIPLRSYHDVTDYVYFTSCDLFYNRKFVLFNSHSSYPSLPSGSHRFALCIYEFVSAMLLFFNFPHVSGITWHSSFPVWLISLSSVSTRVSQMARSLSTCGIPSHVHVRDASLYLIVCQWARKSLPRVAAVHATVNTGARLSFRITILDFVG